MATHLSDVKAYGLEDAKSDTIAEAKVYTL